MTHKTIHISVESLTESKVKNKLVNFRIEEDLYNNFRSVCEKRYNKGVSHVLRAVMNEICAAESKGALKAKRK